MRLEERIVLDGAAAVAVAEAAEPVSPANFNHEAVVGRDGAEGCDSGASYADESVATDSHAEAVRVLLVSSGVADADDLAGSAQDDVCTVMFDGGEDDLNDILNKVKASLDGRQASTIGIASHSLGAGSLNLGSDATVDMSTLLSSPEVATFWQNVGALVEADGRIDLLGCDVGAGEAGDQFVAKMEEVTGRDVAASDDATGNAESGGDWVLEDGNVDAAAVYFNQAKLAAFEGTLDTPFLSITPKNGGVVQKLYDTDSDGKYEITTADQLIALSQTDNAARYWSKNYELDADITFDANPTNVDWDADGVVGDADDAKGFLPMGNFSKAFTGSFDGKGHTISNLFIDRPGENHVGMFGIVAGTTVKSLNISSATVAADYRAGILAGSVVNSTISDCATSGSIVGTRDAGGLVGGATLSSVIRSSSGADVQGTEGAGGLIEHVYKSDVTNCFATGEVDSTDNAGGLVGDVVSGGTITSSYASGAVSGERDTGGLVAFTWGGPDVAKVDDCYATGNVSGVTNVGGLVGWIAEDSVVTNSHALGVAVSGSTTKVGRIWGAKNNDDIVVSGNKANLGMTLTRLTVLPDSSVGVGVVAQDKMYKGADKQDGADTSNQAYHVYQDWDSSSWDLTGQHPAIKHAAITADPVNPDADPDNKDPLPPLPDPEPTNPDNPVIKNPYDQKIITWIPAVEIASPEDEGGRLSRDKIDEILDRYEYQQAVKAEAEWQRKSEAYRAELAEKEAQKSPLEKAIDRFVEEMENKAYYDTEISEKYAAFQTEQAQFLDFIEEYNVKKEIDDDVQRLKKNFEQMRNILEVRGQIESLFSIGSLIDAVKLNNASYEATVRILKTDAQARELLGDKVKSEAYLKDVSEYLSYQIADHTQEGVDSAFGIISGAVLDPKGAILNHVADGVGDVAKLGFDIKTKAMKSGYMRNVDSTYLAGGVLVRNSEGFVELADPRGMSFSDFKAIVQDVTNGALIEGDNGPAAQMAKYEMAKMLYGQWLEANAFALPAAGKNQDGGLDTSRLPSPSNTTAFDEILAVYE